MALMPPPRRSSRLSRSTDESGIGFAAAAAAIETGVPNKASTSRETLSSFPNAETFYAKEGRSAARERTAPRERRLEEIESEEEDDDENGDFMAGFARPVISGNAKHAASIPLPRKARATLNEEADDDGFIFSSIRPSDGKQQFTEDILMVPKPSTIAETGARRPPLRAPSSQQEEQQHAAKGLRSEVGSTAQVHAGRDRRVSSGTVKAARRVSMLRDGTTAHPHPMIADEDLFRHCSSDLDVQERLRHLANWTLDRSVKKAISRFHGTANGRNALQSSIHATLRALSSDKILVDWPGRSTRGTYSNQKLRPHPRNEANRKTEKALLETIEVMQREAEQWQSAKDELRNLEEEIRSIEERSEAILRGDVETEHLSSLRHALLQESSASGSADRGDGEEELNMRIRSILAQQAPWLAMRFQGKAASADDHTEMVRLSAELYKRLHNDSAPTARPAAKRRRTTQSRSSEASLTPAPADNENPLAEALQGTEADARWSDVEWNIDQLRDTTHSFAQLAHLANRYSAAVSARGARAIGDLVNNANGQQSSMSGARTVGGAVGTSSRDETSTISRESQETLQRILSGLRRIEDMTAQDAQADTVDHAQSHVAPGDISEGDILRAFAGISSHRS